MGNREVDGADTWYELDSTGSVLARSKSQVLVAMWLKTGFTWELTEVKLSLCLTKHNEMQTYGEVNAAPDRAKWLATRSDCFRLKQTTIE